jgi:hypothetical protein
MNFLKSVGNAMAPGINVRNETDVPVLFVLSQLSPLHWTRVDPHETVHIDCGRVWFTISTEPYNAETEPTGAEVAMRIAAITATTVLTGGILGIGLVGGASALTSYHGVKQDGIFADGKTVVIGAAMTEDSNIGTLRFIAFEPKLTGEKVVTSNKKAAAAQLDN